MNHFNLGSLRNWQQVAVGEIHSFEVPTSGHRSVNVEFMADGFVSVHAVSGSTFWLVACGSGHVSTRFAIDVNVGVVVMGDPEANVFMRTHVQTQVIDASLDASFTTVEPRQAGPSDEVKRMMQLVRINERRRDKILSQHLEDMRKAATPPEAANPAPVAPPEAPET